MPILIIFYLIYLIYLVCLPKISNSLMFLKLSAKDKTVGVIFYLGLRNVVHFREIQKRNSLDSCARFVIILRK